MNMEKEKMYGYLKHSSTVFKGKAKYRRQIKEQNIKIRKDTYRDIPIYTVHIITKKTGLK